MTVSRARRRAAAAALAGVVLLAMPAAAQVGAPIKIGPRAASPQQQEQSPAPPADFAAPGLPLAPQLSLPSTQGQGLQQPALQPPALPPSRTTSDGSITIDSLRRLTADAVGTLTPPIGGLQPDMWAGTPGEIAVRLVSLMPAAPDSQALRDLARRALLTAGPSPADLTPEGVLLTGRAWRLLAMGAVDDLGALEAVVPGGGLPVDLARVFTEAALARGDDDHACALFDHVTDTATDAFWIKVAMVCDQRAGRDAKVDFGARLLTEVGDDDPLMSGLAQAASSKQQGGGQSGAAFRMGGAMTVHLAFARVAGLAIDPDVSAITSLPVLVSLSRGAGAPPFATRLEAAEKAERAGAIPPEAVTGLYDEVSVAVDTVDGAIAIAEADPGPFGRAILWRVAEAQTVPVARAQAIDKAMELALDESAWRQTVRLFAPFLVSLAPGPEVDWFSERAVRGLIAAGDIRAARPWIDRMRRLMASGSKDAADVWLRLWPAVRIAGGDAVTPYDEQSVGRWWERLRDIDPDQASVRGAAALALMAALDDPVGDDAWRGLTTLPAVDVQAVPATAYAFALRSAVASRRLGETVVLSAAALGETPLGELAVPPLADIVRALVAVGLEAEARRFAAEAALAHGL